MYRKARAEQPICCSQLRILGFSFSVYKYFFFSHLTNSGIPCSLPCAMQLRSTLQRSISLALSLTLQITFSPLREHFIQFNEQLCNFRSLIQNDIFEREGEENSREEEKQIYVRKFFSYQRDEQTFSIFLSSGAD